MQQQKINIHCGKKVQGRRQELGYSQEELAGAVGLTRTSIVNIEAGRQGLTVENLLKMCAVLKSKVDDILPPVPAVKLTSTKKVKRVIEDRAMEAVYKW